MNINANRELIHAIRHLINTACHYRVDEFSQLYAPDLLIVMVDEIGHTMTLDYEQNLSFFRTLRDQGMPPLDTTVSFHHVQVHDEIGYVTATRLLDLGMGRKRIVFTLMLRRQDGSWRVFREHAVMTGDAEAPAVPE